jgi:hypothetical protein
MKEQFNHKLITSFYLWMDNFILDKGQGYVNKTQRLNRQIDRSNPLAYSWASPHQHWNWDSSVSGANVINAVTTSSGNILTRASGVKFDYINGRVLSNFDWGPVLTGSYSKKEFNLYTAEEDDVEMYLESILDNNKDISVPETGANAYQFVAPCIILTLTNNKNAPFALGGQDTSKSSMRAFVITNNKFNKEAIDSLCRDAARRNIPLVNTGDLPINEYGDLKSGTYSYTSLASTYNNADIHINTVETIKMGEKVNKNKNYSLSLIDFDLEVIRYPHAG